MASSYFFLREDQKCGPVSSSQLKTMAASGLIGPDDLVWKEGFPKWIPARNLKGLFPEVSSSGQPHPLPNRVVENQSRSNSPSLGSDPVASGDSIESEDQKSPVLSEVQHETILEQAADAVTSFKKNAGDATRLVANRSERVKISNWSLPKAYAALGRDCFQNQRHEIRLSEHYENLKSIQNELSQIKAKSDSLETSGTLSDMVRTGATKAAIFAQAKVLDAKASSVLVQIGKTAFKEYGSGAGPEELVDRVEKSLRRISELDEENAALGQAPKGKWITKKRLKYAAGAFIALTILGALVGKPEKRTSGNDSGIEVETEEPDSAVLSENASDDIWKNAPRNRYEVGYRQGVSFGSRMNRAREIAEKEDMPEKHRKEFFDSCWSDAQRLYSEYEEGANEYGHLGPQYNHDLANGFKDGFNSECKWYPLK